MMKTDATYRAEAEDHVRGLGIPAGNARQTAVAARVDEMRVADRATEKVATDQKEAGAERARIASVVRTGTDRDRGRQALRAALLAPISAEATPGLLAAMLRDADAAPEALAIPAHVAFGTAAAQAERRRIAGAFSRPEAEGRFAATVSLVLVGGEGLTGEQIAPLLASLPSNADRPRQKTLAERAAERGEFGADFSGHETRAEQAAAGWRKAVAAANRSIGVPDAEADTGPRVYASFADAEAAIAEVRAGTAKA